jgi:phosphate transport system ATP-binding protein
MKEEESIIQSGTYSNNGTLDKKAFAIEFVDVNVWHHKVHILRDINIGIEKNAITCIIGHSGGGKSTLVRSINRINDEIEGFKLKGLISLHGEDIYAPKTDVSEVRRKIGMVFQKPTVFPRSILENVLFGIQHYKKLTKEEAHEIAEANLKAVSLWNEVSNRLHEKASTLSIGQQQRLCIARTLAVKPEVILMDEPTSALDPESSAGIEKLILSLKKDYTIINVTHNLEQAKKIADNVLFLCQGKVIECAEKNTFFNSPSQPQTRDYITTLKCEC